MTAKRTRWLAACTLIAYSAILIRLVVFKAIPAVHTAHLRLKFAGPHTGPANLVPFRTILPELKGNGNHIINLVNLIGNVIPFMPLGLLSPIVFQSFSWQKALILGVLTGLAFEVMEIIFRVGIFDVDDLILNTFGVAAGYILFVLLRRRARPCPGLAL